MLDYLRPRLRIGGVTMGERGCFGRRKRRGAHHAGIAYSSPARDRHNGAGDVFHGAYVYSCLAHPDKKWKRPFRVRARGLDPQDTASRNEAGLPA